MDRVRLIIIDKSQIFRDGLKNMLERETDIQIIRVCAVLGEDIRQFLNHKPDVVMICTKLIECDGAEAIGRIHELSPHTNIIALCDSDSDIECIFAVKAGARACISKDMSFTDMVRAIELVAHGEVIISSTMAGAMLEEFKLLERVKGTTGLGTPSVLSHRENDVITLVAQGLTNKEIADMLFISKQTVMVHMRNIMRKLHAHTRQQAVAFMKANDERGAVEKTGVL